jgi:hypothetical protein
VSRLWGDEVCVHVSCYDKPENIRYLFSPRLCFLWRCSDRTFYVNKRFVGGWLGRLSILSAIRYYNGCVGEEGGGEQGGGV